LAKALAQRCKEIAEKEGLDGPPIDQYVRLIQKHRQNLRAALQEVESCDRDTGIPARVPRRVKLAWMQTSADDEPPRADLAFRVRRLRRTVAKRVSLAMVCPVENGATGHRTD
jgi:hypothetical protein